MLAALKKEHSDVITATLQFTQEHYSLTVEVKYDFLPPIQEIINFAPKVISDKDMSDMEIKNYFHEIKLLRTEVASISNCDVTVVEMNGSGGSATIEVAKQDTLVTWSIQASSGLSNIVRLNITHLNKRTGETKKSKFIQDDQVSVFASSGCGSVEMRFLVKPIEGFDHLVFKLESAVKGKMLITKERV